VSLAPRKIEGKDIPCRKHLGALACVISLSERRILKGE